MAQRCAAKQHNLQNHLMASKGFTQTALVSLTVGETERGRTGVMESVSTRCVVGLCFFLPLACAFFSLKGVFTCREGSDCLFDMVISS